MTAQIVEVWREHGIHSKNTQGILWILSEISIRRYNEQQTFTDYVVKVLVFVLSEWPETLSNGKKKKRKDAGNRELKTVRELFLEVEQVSKRRNHFNNEGRIKASVQIELFSDTRCLI